jgi:hypothetical protein
MEAASEATHEADSIGEWLSPVRNDAAGKLDWPLPKDRLPQFGTTRTRDVNGLTCRSQGHRLISEAGEWHSRRRIPSHFGVFALPQLAPELRSSLYEYTGNVNWKTVPRGTLAVAHSCP